jgi:hypothetical protein
MYLYLIVPFRTHFSLKSSSYVSLGDAYKNFWKNFATKLDAKEQKKISLLHQPKEKNMRFKVIHEDSNLLREEILKINEDEKIKTLINEVVYEQNKMYFPNNQNEKIKFVEGTSNFTLFDNTIGIFEITLEIPSAFFHKLDSFLENIQHWGNDVCNKIVQTTYNDTILPLIKKIVNFDKNRKFIANTENHYGFPDISKKKNLLIHKAQTGQPLWVNRTLIQNHDSKINPDLINKWIFTHSSITDIINTLEQYNDDEKNSAYLGWGNNFIYNEINSNVVKDAKKALLLSQYYYGVLDSLNINLSYIIGQSNYISKFKESKNYNSLLKELVNIVSIIRVGYIDTLQNFQGDREFFFRQVIESWSIPELFENIEQKSNVCKEKISEIYKHSMKKSQFIVELLLFFLGGISLLEFVNTLITFWSNKAGTKDDIPGLYDLGAQFSPDGLLWSGMILLIVFFILYSNYFIKGSKE